MLKVCKQGQKHKTQGINCQDYGLTVGNVRMVMDGCSAGTHSEVGVKVLGYMLEKYNLITQEVILEEFERVMGFIGDTSKGREDFMCFTLLWVEDLSDVFKVFYCGDGFIITENYEGVIEFEAIEEKRPTDYYVYNYYRQPKEAIISVKTYSKEDYKQVGVATDGLKFIMGYKEEQELKQILQTGTAVQLGRFVNRNIEKFKDDITIVY